MKNRISLDDPDYNQNQQVVIQDNKAKIVWIISKKRGAGNGTDKMPRVWK